MSSSLRKHFRARIHDVIDELSDEDLVNLWSAIAEVYYDSYMLKAIQTAKRSPGDSLTHEEALQFLAQS